MKALRVYIVEDQPLITVNIRIALKKKKITVVGDSSSFKKAIAGIGKEKPNLVLLDIQLDRGKDGIDLAKWLDERNISYLYLTSQTDPITLDRVKLTNPLGYIVKPFTEAGLLSNIELAWHQICQQEADVLHIKSEGRSYQLNQSTILYLKAFDNYCYVVTNEREYLVPHTLKKMSEALNKEYFEQAHRSYWVNLNKISALKASALVLGVKEIPLSYSKKNRIKSRLNS